jgi:prepilin-type N-terminal cleavage/methylation domain-containing protein
MRSLLPHLRDQRGVTLMETLVVITVMTVLLLIVTEVFILNYDVYLKQTGRIEADTGTVFAARSISEQARGATQVMASRTIDGTLYTTSDTTLVLELPSIEQDGDVLIATYDYIAFARDPGDATRVITATDAASGSSRFDGTKLLTAFNDTMTFRYNDPVPADATRVSVLLINETTVRESTFRSQAWTSVFLRNR